MVPRPCEQKGLCSAAGSSRCSTQEWSDLPPGRTEQQYGRASPSCPGPLLSPLPPHASHQLTVAELELLAWQSCAPQRRPQGPPEFRDGQGVWLLCPWNWMLVCFLLCSSWASLRLEWWHCAVTFFGGESQASWS